MNNVKLQAVNVDILIQKQSMEWMLREGAFGFHFEKHWKVYLNLELVPFQLFLTETLRSMEGA